MKPTQDRVHISTGSSTYAAETRLVAVPYDNYEIVVRLSQSNEFLGIAELRVKSDFLSPGQRVAASGYLDVEEFYRD